MPVKPKAKKFMTGSLKFCELIDEGIDPNNFKTFKNLVMPDEPGGQLYRGNILPKSTTKEESLIFECLWDETPSSFRIFLYENGTALGIVEYATDSKEYFRGHYRKGAKNKISLWGVWSEDKAYKLKYAVIIELR